MRNKRGSEKYYILMSLILGLLVLGISLYFIFHDYFTQEDIDWEACRESIYLRQLMPTSEKPVTYKLDALKDMFPLKCKTEVIKLEIDPDADTDDKVVKSAMKAMADRMVQCFRIFGEGKYKIFPVNFKEKAQDCAICTRVDFDEEFENQDYIFDFFPYLRNHDLDGNFITPGSGNAVSYEDYLGIQTSNMDKLVFLTKDTGNCDTNGCEYGQKKTHLNPDDGDLLIGMYFYSDRDSVSSALIRGRATKYQWNTLFYTQVGDPALSDCDIRSIPA